MYTATTFTDRTAFAARALPYLMRREAAHNLLIGLIDTLIYRPEVYPSAHMVTVQNEAQEVVGVALQTPPHPISVSLFDDLAAISAAAEAFLAYQDDVSQIGGFAQEARAFADHWQKRTQCPYEVHMPQLLYRVDQVLMPEGVAGTWRAATLRDQELLITWYIAFERDAFPESTPKRDKAKFSVMRALQEKDRGIILWEVEGRPVSMAGYGSLTPHGARIGPVYTSDEERGKGYAKAVTATLSQWLMSEHRKRFCVLYTDANNPASNAAYRRIGYRPIAETIMLNIQSPTTS